MTACRFDLSAGRRVATASRLFLSHTDILPMTPTAVHSNEIRRSLELLHAPGDVFEIRLMDVPPKNGRGKPFTASGYFDDSQTAAEAAGEYAARGTPGIYATLNPVHPGLLARYNQRIKEYVSDTTTNPEIQRRGWLVVDIDPTRPKKIPSTDAEKQAAGDLAIEIDEKLRARGWPYPLTADSGNGCYLFYKVDLPNDQQTAELFKRFYLGLQTLLEPQEGTATAHIDVTTHNAARIIRIGGVNIKGDGSTDRPHRRCQYVDPIPGYPVDVVPIELIRDVADLAESAGQNTTHHNNRPNQNHGGNGSYRLLVDQWLQARGVAFTTKTFGDGRQGYLITCPFDESHNKGETFIAQEPSGKLSANCKHNSCSGKGWQEFKQAIGEPEGHHFDPPLSSNGKSGQSHNQQAGDTNEQEESQLQVLTVGDLAEQYPRLRKPLIDGVLRVGETANVISSPKMGKSWLVSDLALSVVTGRPWLDSFEVEAGPVLIVDNELHGNTISYRIQKVGAARDILFADYRDSLHVANLRGKLTDIYQLGPRLFDRIEPDTYRLVIIDAFYRAIPEGVDENSNSQIAQVYNQIDAYALQLGCGFICIHHTTKGNQSGKSITDVGSGAGSQSRATDTHLILRPHAEPGAVVLEAAARSWPPIDPVALRWDWPLWTVANDLDSDDLKPEREGRQAKERERKQAEHCERVIEALRELGGQETKRQIKIAASLNSDNFDRAVFRLMRKRDAQEPQIEAIDIVKRNRKYPGLRLLEQGNGTDGTDGTNQDTQLLSR